MLSGHKTGHYVRISIRIDCKIANSKKLRILPGRNDTQGAWPQIDFIDDRDGCLFTATVHRKKYP